MSEVMLVLLLASSGLHGASVQPAFRVVENGPAGTIRILRENTLEAELWPELSPLRQASAAGPDRTNYRLLEKDRIAVIRLYVNWDDYRGSSVPPGVYQLRYAVQPILKDHAGVSRFRDFLLLDRGSPEGHPIPMALFPPRSLLGDPPRIYESEGQTILEIDSGGVRLGMVYIGKGEEE